MVATGHVAAVLQKLEAGAWLEAERQARAALTAAPDDPSICLLLALAVAAMGEASRAAPLLNHLSRLRPDAAHPCADLAGLNRPPPPSLIRRQFEACLLLSPGDARLRLAFGEFLLDHDRAAEAEALLTDALPPEATADPLSNDPAANATPDSAAACHMIGLARAEQGKFQAAIAAFNHAVMLDPDAAASWSNLGMVLKIQSQFEASIVAHDQAVELCPDDARFRVNRSVALLKAGHWQDAWQDYEWRLKLAGAPSLNAARLLPSLSELGDLHGLTIVALHEEGYGDTLQFLRYLPLLAARGARVLACVPPPLVRLVTGVPGVAGVCSDDMRLPQHDFVCPFFSLPRAFGTTLDNIPPAPRLAPDPTLTRQWTPRLPREGMLVGLVWAGQSRPWLPGFRTLDRRRSAGLPVFEPLSRVAGVRLVSLQMGPAAQQAPPLGMTLFKPMTPAMDFADTAAIVAALDVVVSVDTSVVHLAGLLGKPVFLLDRYDGCWRWLSGRRDSPWYPKLTIYRQDEPGEWEAPMRRIAASLEALALFHGAGDRTSMSGSVREPACVA